MSDPAPSPESDEEDDVKRKFREALAAGDGARTKSELTEAVRAEYAGELRVGVSRTLAVRALAQHAGLDPGVVAHRLMGAWQPTPQGFAQLVAGDVHDADLSRPYPFFLASPLANYVHGQVLNVTGGMFGGMYT